MTSLFFMWFQMLTVSHNNVVVIVDPIVIFDYNGSLALVFLWTSMMYFSICAIPISYLFRYRIACQHKAFPVKLHFSCLIIAGTFSIVYGLHFCYGICVRTKRYIYLTNVLIPWHLSKETSAICITGTVGF